LVVQRGEIWWANLPEPTGSEPGFRRPVLVVQSNEFNQSRIATVIAVVLTSNLKLAQAPGNMFYFPKKQPISAKTRLPTFPKSSQLINLS